MSKQAGVVRGIQMELFQVEALLSEFEAKRKELKARLARMGAGTKVCTKCKEEMDIEQFYRDRQKIDRRSSWCCECKQTAGRERWQRKSA